MSTKKAVLGRGLEALLPPPSDVEEGASSADQNLYDFHDHYRVAGRVSEVSVGVIRANPYQPRKHFDPETLNELAASIKQFGLIQPVAVRAVDDGRFELISGERRWRAARIAGIEHIPAYIREADAEAMLEMALVENVQREELDPIEVAQGFEQLIEECGLTHEQVAEKIGKNRPTVTNTLRLLKLSPAVQVSLRKRAISVGHARALLAIEEAAEQERLLAEIIRRGLSVRQVERKVRALTAEVLTEAEPEERKTVDAESNRDSLQIRAIEGRLRSRFSTQIQIKHQSSSRGGRIELEFYSDDDLDRLVEILLSEH